MQLPTTSPKSSIPLPLFTIIFLVASNSLLAAIVSYFLFWDQMLYLLYQLTALLISNNVCTSIFVGIYYQTFLEENGRYILYLLKDPDSAKNKEETDPLLFNTEKTTSDGEDADPLLCNA